MNPSSSSTSTPSASPPASVAEKPPRPPSSPKPPAWASASPSLGETASATTFSSTPDTAISGAFRSNPPSASPSRAIASKPPDGRPPTLATKSISSSPGSSPKICGTSSPFTPSPLARTSLLLPRRTQSAHRKISRGLVPDGLPSLRTNRARANRTRLRQPEPGPRLLPLRATLRPLCRLPPLPPAHLIPSCHSESASAVRNLLLSLQPSLRGVPVSRQFCETWHSRPDLNGFVSGYAFRRTAPRTPLPARAHQAQLLHAAPVPLTPV